VNCEGCGTPLGVIEGQRWQVCLDCTKARHRAAMNGQRCTCGAKRNERVVTTPNRAWVACDRCLGVVRNLPDPVRTPRGSDYTAGLQMQQKRDRHLG